MLEAHAYVTGMVQGVGFRASVRRYAEEHDLKGFVANLPDGRVEFVVQGKKENVEKFLAELQTSPGLGRVDQLDITRRNVTKSFPSFEIVG
jgi:acylphosphatase